MAEPIIRPKLSTFEQELLDRLDVLIKKQDDIIKAVWASSGVDIEYEQYKNKYRNIKERAKHPELSSAGLDYFGIEVVDD